jgi:hypothetical protein
LWEQVLAGGKTKTGVQQASSRPSGQQTNGEAEGEGRGLGPSSMGGLTSYLDILLVVPCNAQILHNIRENVTYSLLDAMTEFWFGIVKLEAILEHEATYIYELN